MTDAGFWLEKWRKDDLGFHEGKPNTLLVTHFAGLGLAPGDRVFVPLCGKARDIAWLHGQGYRVAGVELSELAVRQLFRDLRLDPEISDAGALQRYRAEGIDIFVGDIFDLSEAILGPVDGVYDRAALVALPESTRPRYARHLAALVNEAPQLLLTFVYDQRRMAGPPFSVGEEEIRRHYAGCYGIRQVANVAVAGGLKGLCAADEQAWLLLR